MDDRERLRRLRAYAFDDHPASPADGPGRRSAPSGRQTASDTEPTPSPDRDERVIGGSKDGAPPDPLGDPFVRLTRLWMSWVLGDPEIRTDWRHAGPAAWVFVAWNLPAWLVLFAGMWVKDTYNVEDPLGIAGAILAAALFALVWFGGARLTLHWWRRHSG